VLGMMSSACSPKSPGKPEFCPISASFTKNWTGQEALFVKFPYALRIL
jgi:hypothetical protein